MLQPCWSSQHRRRHTLSSDAAKLTTLEIPDAPIARAPLPPFPGPRPILSHFLTHSCPSPLLSLFNPLHATEVIWKQAPSVLVRQGEACECAWCVFQVFCTS